MTKRDLAKIEFFAGNFVKAPVDLKMCANACGATWTVKEEPGAGLECYNMYLKPDYFGRKASGKLVVISVLFNPRNCRTTRPCVFMRNADKIKKAHTIKFWKGNGREYYFIPHDLLKRVNGANHEGY